MAKKPVRDASHHLTNVKLAHRPPPPNRDDCPKVNLLCDETKEESIQYVGARMAGACRSHRNPGRTKSNL
jgi:hypothetical protein